MIKLLILSITIILFTGCVNKRGVSLTYYNDCEEYYDLQGYYHKDCKNENMYTYKEIQEGVKKGIDTSINKIKEITPFVESPKVEKKEPLPQPNVW